MPNFILFLLFHIYFAIQYLLNLFVEYFLILNYEMLLAPEWQTTPNICLVF